MAREANLLLIDDDRIVRESIAAYLEDSGYTVVEASDGEEGLEHFLHSPPQLVICDLAMPRLDGLSLLRMISEQDQAVPVIVISGAGGMADVVEALRLGASDYLVKPIVDMEVLEHSIERSIERAQLIEENQRYREELERTNRELTESLFELEQDQQAGSQLQLKLFPHAPLTAPPFHFEHRLIPSLYLSGDFLEYNQVTEHTFDFYLADVSGHGASSAFVTALLRHLSLNVQREKRDLASEVARFGQPSAILSYFNRELIVTDIDRHVTIFYGVIDTQLNQLTYSVAGHLPMPILVQDSEADYLQGTAMPLGILQNARYQDYVVDLADEFSLIVASDGVLELLPVKGLINQEAFLLDTVRQGNHTLSGLERVLALDTVKEPPDDVALLVVNRSS